MISYFISVLTPTPNTVLRGAGGNLKVKGKGTVKWKIEDDNSKVHTIIIKDCMYVPGISTCLLAPQYWTQQARDHFPRRRGTWCVTYDDACILEWNQRKYYQTIDFDFISNTPMMYILPRSVQPFASRWQQ